MFTNGTICLYKWRLKRVSKRISTTKTAASAAAERLVDRPRGFFRFLRLPRCTGHCGDDHWRHSGHRSNYYGRSRRSRIAAARHRDNNRYRSRSNNRRTRRDIGTWSTGPCSTWNSTAGAGSSPVVARSTVAGVSWVGGAVEGGGVGGDTNTLEGLTGGMRMTTPTRAKRPLRRRRWLFRTGVAFKEIGLELFTPQERRVGVRSDLTYSEDHTLCRRRHKPVA